jgi:CRISPR-associated endonuclease/helicase Cas3
VEDGVEASRLLPDGKTENLGIFETDRAAIKALCQAMHAKRVHVSGRDVTGLRDIQADSAATRIVYLQKKTTEMQTGSETDLASLTGGTVQLRSHSDTARAVAISLTQRPGLDAGLADVIVIACERHDTGKNRRWWQAAIGNEGPEPLAKSSESFFDHDLNAGYRHEFGSLLEAADDQSLTTHPHRELILHLIAAHHGWGRPSFEPTAYDRSRPRSVCEQVAHEVALRFARLQRRYGWWQLAYLEALVKCVDAIASANPNWQNT